MVCIGKEIPSNDSYVLNLMGRAMSNWRWWVKGGFMYVEAPFECLRTDIKGASIEEVINIIPPVIEEMWAAYEFIMSDPINEQREV